MRKYTNVDIIAALGAVVELNTAHYKGDFKHDIERLKAAARNPDGENSRFLWLSRQSGTYCFPERDVYIKDTAAHNFWHGSAKLLGSHEFYQHVIVSDRILAYAVNITGIEKGRIKGDLYELDYRDHIRHLNKTALPLHTVTAKYADGAILTMPHQEYDDKYERLYYQHGQLQTLKPHPEDAGALRDVLTQAREQREKDARPAAFKVRVATPKQPSIKEKIAAGQKQLADQRAAAPKRAAVKNNNIGLED